MTQQATSPTLLKEGLLWQDLQHKPIAQAVTDAARRYRERFGVEPTECHVSPQHYQAEWPGEAKGGEVGPVRLVPDCRVRPWHYWVGRVDIVRD
jgi:hypothetical protein